MIEFLQDYQTRALPPETFKRGEQVKRSEDSEQYFVRLGVAGFVTNGGLVDQDHLPITPAAPVSQVVTPGERRASVLGGRAGELALGLDTPQRATSGPGTAALIGGDQQTAAIASDVDRLILELETANAAGGDLTQKLQQALDDLQAERHAHAATRDQIAGLNTSLGAADNGRAEAEREVGDLKARVTTLEGQLAEAMKPAGEQQEQKPAEKPAKAK
ncbi:hypothetical protein [uncultured Sphingomonas sp.]|uniref:hypothetical protein n=1 Tax=uncultured Sphingomonas sp. TaxID=158754 RepID=UPI0025E0E0F0|nr:hypothetical protein [uncultured Sphingomonas sp.]